jgi:hypothetical protein
MFPALSARACRTLRSSSSPPNHKEHAKRPHCSVRRRLPDVGRRPVDDVFKSSVLQAETQPRSIKPTMEYGVIISMELSIIRVQIGNGKVSSRNDYPVELIKKGPDVFDMMEGHGGDHGIKAAFQDTATLWAEIYWLRIKS